MIGEFRRFKMLELHRKAVDFHELLEKRCKSRRIVIPPASVVERAISHRQRGVSRTPFQQSVEYLWPNISAHDFTHTKACEDTVMWTKSNAGRSKSAASRTKRLPQMVDNKKKK